MHDGERRPDLGDELLSSEDLETVDQLGNEYRSHMRRQAGKIARRKPVEEVAKEFRSVLNWLMVEDIESANNQNVTNSDELYLDYSAYDVEDTYFIVYSELSGRRGVRVEDIIREHEETNLRAWQEQQTKMAADFLILHGANETEINQWKSVEGTARQQRAMRRMFWLLQEPYMEQFKDFLRQRATTESPYNFGGLANTVREIIMEGQQNLSIQQQHRDDLIPRKQEELNDTALWLQRADNICKHVFEKDIEEQVYDIKR
ncbi:hypothetical protein KW801_01965 [Candidatus Saccharibacteria bacterium]|nr:hypothetical protein [Candidatus Saccharibacteria bacterium]